MTQHVLEILNRFYAYSKAQADDEHALFIQMLLQLPREYIHEYVISL